MILRLDLPPLAGAQRRAAAQFAAEPDLSCPREAMRIILGPRLEQDRSAYLARCGRLQVNPASFGCMGRPQDDLISSNRRTDDVIWQPEADLAGFNLAGGRGQPGLQAKGAA